MQERKKEKPIRSLLHDNSITTNCHKEYDASERVCVREREGEVAFDDCSAYS